MPLVLACFALLPSAQAETPELLPSPTPDGGYPGHNTAEGFHALFNRTTGVWDSGFGDSALFHDTTGTANTALGYNAMFNNLGAVTTPLMALLPSLAIPAAVVTRPCNSALYKNTTGGSNTATGAFALQFNTTGLSNTANGFDALNNNTGGSGNTATGIGALVNNMTGGGNTAIGANALYLNNGSRNIALGFEAGVNLTTGNNNIDIGNPGVADESSTIRIGFAQTRAFIAGIRGRTTGLANAVPVLIDGHWPARNGQFLAPVQERHQIDEQSQ
jgi:hypothetical protein